MNRSTELKIIDFSSLETMNKGGEFSSYENMVAILENYIFYNNPNGFTKKDEARNYIKSLNPDDIRKELLKNIIKKHYCADLNSYASILGTNKGFNDDLSVPEADFLLFNAVSQMQMISVDNIIDRYPKLTDLMVKSFVNSRYFDRSYLANNLDNININECQNLLFKIESYYAEKANNDLENDRKLIS